jgi:hypothetical protein
LHDQAIKDDQAIGQLDLQVVGTRGQLRKLETTDIVERRLAAAAIGRNELDAALGEGVADDFEEAEDGRQSRRALESGANRQDEIASFKDLNLVRSRIADASQAQTWGRSDQSGDDSLDSLQNSWCFRPWGKREVSAQRPELGRAFFARQEVLGDLNLVGWGADLQLVLAQGE